METLSMKMRTRSSSLSESFIGRRNRTGSMVQSIALNVPIIENYLNYETGNGGNLLQQHNKKRTKSLTDVLCAKKELINLQRESSSSMLYPLTKQEKSLLWNKYTFNSESEFAVDLVDQYLIEEKSDSEFIDFKDYLMLNQFENEKFLGETNNIIADLNESLTINDQVTLQTMDFQVKSSELIAEFEQLSILFRDLSNSLSIFESLDPIVQTLNASSSGSIVTKDSFTQFILGKLDSCLTFVYDPKNSDYKEIEVYKHRFKQCMVRALTLIKNYINSGIKDLESILRLKIHDEKKRDSSIISCGSSIMIEALTYRQFEEDCLYYHPLIQELYTRAVTNQHSTDEYMGLLNDCYNQYFRSRSGLLNFIVQKHLETQDNSKSLVQTAQANIIYFNKLMEREYSMFQRIFFVDASKTDDKVDNSTNINSLIRWFETLLEPLYFLLRHKTIRENSIGELCGLISILQNYTETEEADETEVGEGAYRHEQTLQEQLHLTELFNQILEDTQTRLMFRVQAFVDKHIVSYKKTGKELTIVYRRHGSVASTNNELDMSTTINGPTGEPDFSAMESDISSSQVQQLQVNADRERAESIMPLESSTVTFDYSPYIYPPISDAIKLLMKIYQLLNQDVFDDLANSVVHLAILSMRENFGTMLGIEPKLYQIKNLMFFKEYVSGFEIEYVKKETNLDFSGLRNLFKRFIKMDGSQEAIDNDFAAANLGNTETSNFMNLIWGTVPKVVSDFVDCKSELQIALRNEVHEFVQETSKVFLHPLSCYPTKYTLQKTMTKFENGLKNELPKLKPRITNYIEDSKVLSYLIDGVQEIVMKEYEIFYHDCIQNERSEQLEHLVDIDTIISIWADIVSEMLANDLTDNDLLSEDGFSASVSDVEELDLPEASTSIAENGDISNLNLNSLK